MPPRPSAECAAASSRTAVDGGLAGRCHRRIRRRGCGYDASRKREAWTTSSSTQETGPSGPRQPFVFPNNFTLLLLAALFVTYAPQGRLKPHVPIYLEALCQEGFSEVDTMRYIVAETVRLERNRAAVTRRTSAGAWVLRDGFVSTLSFVASAVRAQRHAGRWPVMVHHMTFAPRRRNNRTCGHGANALRVGEFIRPNVDVSIARATSPKRRPPWGSVRSLRIGQQWQQ
jgi:hypothetical protein